MVSKESIFGLPLVPNLLVIDPSICSLSIPVGLHIIDPIIFNHLGDDIIDYSTEYLHKLEGYDEVSRTYIPTPPHHHNTLEVHGVKLCLHTPPNCSLLNPKQWPKLRKLSFQNKFGKYISNLIINSTTNKCDNVLMHQLSHIMIVKFNVLHITMRNRIIDHLCSTLIIIIKNGRGYDREAKFFQELLIQTTSISTLIAPQYFSLVIDKEIDFCFLDDQTKGP